MMERLQKIIARAGIASRRHAETLILEGAVSVNGAVVTTLGTKVDPARDHVKVHGKGIPPQTRSVYLLLNKPKGHITSVSDPQGRPTVMDLIPDVTERVYPVGRLDYDSEGLLVLTNDGELAQKLMHPRHEVEKRYWVKVSGHPTEATLRKVAQGGISIPTGRTAPCQVRSLSETEEYSWLEVALHEGKNREIRRVMEKIGHPVNKLKRVGYAFLKIGNLSPGAYRHLTPDEVARLQRCGDKKDGEQEPEIRHRPKGRPEAGEQKPDVKRPTKNPGQPWLGQGPARPKLQEPEIRHRPKGRPEAGGRKPDVKRPTKSPGQPWLGQGPARPKLQEPEIRHRPKWRPEAGGRKPDVKRPTKNPGQPWLGKGPARPKLRKPSDGTRHTHK